MTSKIENYAREREEDRLEQVVREMYLAGRNKQEIHKYLCNEADLYLAELGYNRNGEETP